MEWIRPIMLAETISSTAIATIFLLQRKKIAFACADVTQPNQSRNGLEPGRRLFRPRDRPTENRLMNIQTDPSLLKGVIEPLPASADQPIRSTFFHEANHAQARRRAGASQARRSRPQRLRLPAPHPRERQQDPRRLPRHQRGAGQGRRHHAGRAMAARQPLSDRRDGLPGQARPAAALLQGAAGRPRSAAASRCRARWPSPGPMSRTPTARSRPRCSRRSSKATSRSSRSRSANCGRCRRCCVSC